MRVIKTKHFPFNGYKAINLFGVIFTKGELSNKELNHEAIHTEQMKEMLYIFFYIWYGVEYLIIRLFHIKQHDAYKDVSLKKKLILMMIILIILVNVNIILGLNI